MPPLVIGEAALVSVCEAIKAVCHLTEIQLETATPEQKQMMSQLNVEMMKPWLALLTFFNKQLEKQLEK